MKKCPFCEQMLQDEAHHCHHCNSMLKDMDGNMLGLQPEAEVEKPDQVVWLEVVMKVLLTIFFTVQFFIAGIVILRSLFGIAIIEMNSTFSILANILVLAIAVTGAFFLSPIIFRWAKQNFARVTK
jgi:hypothetical protein